VTTPAGWHATDDGTERYWDGQNWTEQSRGASGAHIVVTQGSNARHNPALRNGRQFAFDGGAATYFGTGLLAFLITVCTVGICYPFALVLRERWRCKHSYINGQQLVFNGSAIALFGLWIKWFLLMIVTIGIYGFWLGPRIQRWKWENTGFAGLVVAQPA
jgi:uncharacterized membrane protein YjgN (DUF898 family)